MTVVKFKLTAKAAKTPGRITILRQRGFVRTKEIFGFALEAEYQPTEKRFAFYVRQNGVAEPHFITHTIVGEEITVTRFEQSYPFFHLDFVKKGDGANTPAYALKYRISQEATNVFRYSPPVTPLIAWLKTGTEKPVLD